MITAEESISKIAFLFVAYAVISGGIVAKGLSCQFQKALENNIYVQHLVGFLLIFVFIMLEGGWDFSTFENEKADRDWSSGNSLHTLVFSFFLYVIFMLSSKMRFWQSVAFLGGLLFLYILSTQRIYWERRASISESMSNYLLRFQQSVIGIVFILFIYGISDYYVYQKKSYGSKFNFYKFIIGNPKCNFEK